MLLTWVLPCESTLPCSSFKAFPVPSWPFCKSIYVNTFKMLQYAENMLVLYAVYGIYQIRTITLLVFVH
jgi:hypothetical protein